MWCAGDIEIPLVGSDRQGEYSLHMPYVSTVFLNLQRVHRTPLYDAAGSGRPGCAGLIVDAGKRATGRPNC